MKRIKIILFILLVTKGSALFSQVSSKQQQVLDSLNKIVLESDQDTLIAKAYLELSEVLYLTNFDTVIDLCKNSVRIAKKNLVLTISKEERLSFLTTLSGAYNNLGYVYDDRGNIVKALDYYHKSLRIREELDDKEGIAVSLNNIGIIFVNQGEDKQALKYYLKSLKVKEPLGNMKSISTSLNNIGAVYRNLGENKRALEYYYRALAIRESIGDKRGVSISYNNIGTVFNYQNKLDSALVYYNKALKIREEIGDDRGIVNSLSNLGSVNLKLGNVKAAKEYAKKSLKLSNELGYSGRIRDAANLMSRVYQKENNWKKAFAMQKLYVKMRDSIRNEKSKLSSFKVQAKYEIDEVEREKVILEKEKSIEILKASRNRMVSIFFIVAFVMALILIAFIYGSYRRKMLINELLEKQKEDVSRKNEEKTAMLKEIHHRVKNNLQVVISLLRLQSSEVNDEEVYKMFEETQNRVLSMARLHEQLYRSDDFKSVDTQLHLTQLIEEIIKDYSIGTNVKLDIDIKDVNLGIKTLIPLGLIVNETISNSLKYGFEGRKEGVVSVHIKPGPNNCFEMIIGDDGVGMSKDFEIDEATSLGTQLIQVFTSQLDGVIERIDKPGTFFKITFKQIDNNKLN